MRRCLLILLVLLWPAFAQATTYWEETFETGFTNWFSGYPDCDVLVPANYCSPTISLDTYPGWPHSGIRSFKGVYHFACSQSFGGTGCGIGTQRTHPSTKDVYTRFYYYTVGFTYDNPSTKNFYHRDNDGGGPGPVFGHGQSTRTQSFAIQGAADCLNFNPETGQNEPYGTCDFFGSQNLNDNQVYCIETHLKLNDPGVANGFAEVWIDGQRKLYTNVHEWVGPNVSNPNGNSSLTTNDLIELIVQDGDGLMYYDDFAVGNTRLNDCGGGSPIDTTPPTPVTNLSVGSATSSSLTITATNGTDLIDTTLNLRLERCTVGATNPCTTFALVSTISVTGGAVSVLPNTGLASNTTYCYRANDSDQTGNQGLYSATACGTTAVSTTPYTAVFDTGGMLTYATDADIWASTEGADGKLYVLYGDGVGMQAGNDVFLGGSTLDGATPALQTGVDTYNGTIRVYAGEELTTANKKSSSIISDGGTALYSWWSSPGEGGWGAARGMYSANNGATWDFSTNYTFTDGFAGTLGSWTTAAGTGYTISGGQLVPAAGFNAMSYNSQQFLDQEIRFQVVTNQEENAGGKALYLVPRANAATGWFSTAKLYAVWFVEKSGANDLIQIKSADGGTGNLLATCDLGGELPAGYQAGAYIIDDTIVALVDGVIVCQAAGGHFLDTAGYLGIMSDSTASLVLDDVKIGWPTYFFHNLVDPVGGPSWLQLPDGYTGQPASMDSAKYYGYHFGTNGITYLSRVARTSVFDRNAYEWVTAIDGNNVPTWGTFANRTAVYPGPGAYQYGFTVSYHAGISGFLGVAFTDTSATIRVIYAPTPWGPWTTVVEQSPFIDTTYKIVPYFPIKYDSGNDVWMVFSGSAPYDNYRMVKMTLTATGAVVLPIITNAVTDTTGSQLTYGTTLPSFVRVQTDTTNEVFDISTITAGRYNRAGGYWLNGLTFVCFFAQNATHVESTIPEEHQCDSLVGLTTTPDTIPPVLSSPAPSGTLAEGTTSTIISMTSDEPADLKYSTTDVAYASMASSMTTVDGLHHSATVTGLTSGSAYTYYVRGQDRSTALNVNTTSTLIAFQVAAPSDTTPPFLSGGSPTGTLAAGTTSVSMTVQTNENATCKYSSTAGTAYAAMATTFGTTGAMAHSTTVAGLVNGTTYTRYVRCIDGAANANTADYSITWTIATPPPDVTPPILSGGSPTGVLAAGTTSVLMQVNTNENATCKYNTVAGRAYTHPSSVLFTTGNGTTAHSTTISGLSNGNTYTRYIRCIDTALNPNPADYPLTWSVAAAADVTPPILSGTSPSGALPSGTTSVTMQLSTNETATCKYGTVASTAYASIANTFTTTGGTTHSQTIGSLSDGVTYTYYVRCQDVALNANTNDTTITWSVTAAADITPPILSGGSPNGTAFPVNTTSVSMQLSTNESATCKYGTVGGTAYASIANTFSTTGGTAHSQTIATANGTTYTYYVRCQDVATNVNVADFTITWSIAAVVTPDTTPPVLTLGGPTGTLPTTTTSVTLTVTSSEVATCKYGTVAATAYASIASTFTTTGDVLHNQTLSVAANTTYTYYVRCIDAAGNANLSDFTITWFVAAAPDVTPAILTNGAPTGTLPTFTTAVTLQVTTSEAATCKYGTIAATAYAGIANTFGTTGGTAHSQALAGLTPNTTYTYYVRCSDASANANLVDFTITWFVDAAPDVIAPIRSVGSPSGVQPIGTTSVPMTLTTDEDATCKFGTVANTAYASIADTFSTTGTTTHSETITPLVNGGSYTYYVRCIDGSANANTIDFIITWSVDWDVTVPVRSAGLPSGVKVAGTTSVSMQVTTDENATCKYGITPGVAYASIANTFSTTGTTAHSQTIGSLVDGQVSTYFIRCRDTALNANLDDFTITWSVAVANDAVAPTAPSALVCADAGSSSQASCTFTPGTDAVGVVSNVVTIGISSGGVCTPDTIINPIWGTTSPQVLVNLTGDVTYCATMQAKDLAGNTSSASNQADWTQPPFTDPIPPSAVNHFEAILGGTLYNVVGLTWLPGTDNVGIARTDIYRCTGEGCTAFDVHFSTVQTGYMDATVAPNTVYRYEAFHADASGNISLAPSQIVRVQTPLSTVGVTKGTCPCKNRH